MTTKTTDRTTAYINISHSPPNVAQTQRYTIVAIVPNASRPILRYAMSVKEAEAISDKILSEIYKHSTSCTVHIQTPTAKHTISALSDDAFNALPFTTEYDLVGDEVTDMDKFDKLHRIKRWRKYTPDELVILDNEHLSLYDRLWLALIRNGFSKDRAESIARASELKHKELAEFNKEE